MCYSSRYLCTGLFPVWVKEQDIFQTLRWNQKDTNLSNSLKEGTHLNRGSAVLEQQSSQVSTTHKEKSWSVWKPTFRFSVCCDLMNPMLLNGKREVLFFSLSFWTYKSGFTIGLSNNCPSFDLVMLYHNYHRSLKSLLFFSTVITCQHV